MEPDCSITPEMLDLDVCRAYWRGKYHPAGACCPRCQISASHQQTENWKTGGKITCHNCGKWYTWRTGTPFSGKKVDERQLVLIAAFSLYHLAVTQIASICRLHPRTVRQYQKSLQVQQG